MKHIKRVLKFKKDFYFCRQLLIDKGKPHRSTSHSNVNIEAVFRGTAITQGSLKLRLSENLCLYAYTVQFTQQLKPNEHAQRTVV